MTKFFWSTLKLSSIVLVATFVVVDRTQASEVPVSDVTSVTQLSNHASTLR